MWNIFFPDACTLSPDARARLFTDKMPIPGRFLTLPAG